MYGQAIRKWRSMGTVETDSSFFRPLVASDSSAWHSFTKANNHYQVIMGINQRFFLTVTSMKIAREEIDQMLRLFPFEKYPK